MSGGGPRKGSAWKRARRSPNERDIEERVRGFRLRVLRRFRLRVLRRFRLRVLRRFRLRVLRRFRLRVLRRFRLRVLRRFRLRSQVPRLCGNPVGFPDDPEWSGSSVSLQLDQLSIRLAARSRLEYIAGNF